MCFSDKGEGNLDVFGVNRYSHIWEMEKDGRMATSPSIAHLISDSTLNGHTATPTALSCAGGQLTCRFSSPIGKNACRGSTDSHSADMVTTGAFFQLH